MPAEVLYANRSLGQQLWQVSEEGEVFFLRKIGNSEQLPKGSFFLEKNLPKLALLDLRARLFA
jgi:hypothetical protein